MGFWEMLEKPTPRSTRPDPYGEEVIRTVGNLEARPPAREPHSSAAANSGGTH